MIPYLFGILPTVLVVGCAFYQTKVDSNSSGPAESTLNLPNLDLKGTLDNPDLWLTYSQNYQGHRYSQLSDINKKNVGGLRPLWMFQTLDKFKRFQTTPIFWNEIVFITEAWGRVDALDSGTGRLLWTFDPDIKRDEVRTVSVANRGLAFGAGKLFVGTLDARLIALDVKTGEVRWSVQVASPQVGYSITSAPLVVDKLVVTGVSGGEFGIRGFIDAYDVNSGRHVWRRWTIPMANEPGGETWPKDFDRDRGGGATWVTGTYDSESQTLFWATGNPGPDYNKSVRQGDNLYSNSLLAIDVHTGKQKWHFQFSPNDEFDYDANATPILFDTIEGDTKQKLIGIATKNGFYYVLDRETGRFRRGKPFTRVTWASGLDSQGRPIRATQADLLAEGTFVYPGTLGGTNFWSPTFYRPSGLFILPVCKLGETVHKAEPKYMQGRMYLGGFPGHRPEVEIGGSILALKAKSGDPVWEFPIPEGTESGLLSTAGGLVFGGSKKGNFFALDAETGKPLWHFLTSGFINAPPITYRDKGGQKVVLAAEGVLLVFGLESNGT